MLVERVERSQLIYLLLAVLTWSTPLATLYWFWAGTVTWFITFSLSQQNISIKTQQKYSFNEGKWTGLAWSCVLLEVRMLSCLPRSLVLLYWWIGFRTISFNLSLCSLTCRFSKICYLLVWLWVWWMWILGTWDTGGQWDSGTVGQWDVFIRGKQFLLDPEHEKW